MRFDTLVADIATGAKERRADLSTTDSFSNMDSDSDDSEIGEVEQNGHTNESSNQSNFRNSMMMRNLAKSGHKKQKKKTKKFGADGMKEAGDSDQHSVAFDQLEMDRVRKEIYKSCAAASDGQLTSGCLLELFAVNGINFKDPRIKSIRHKLRHIGGLRKDITLNMETFCDVIHGSTMLLDKILKGKLIVPDFPDLCKDIDEIYNAIEPLEGGDLATYIPQLGNQDPELLGIAVCTVDGQRYSIGCGDYKFCVQSCCKPIAYLIAAEEHGFDVVHHHIGREPSGAEFNKLHLKDDPTPENADRKIPHNPMINAGAIMSCSLIKRECAMADRFQHIMDTWERLCLTRAGFMNSVYLSEKNTADRNWCLGYMMQEYDSFPENTNLEETLEFYFQQCSIEADIDQMSVLAATLANGGVNPITGDRIFDPFNVRNCLSLMLSSGMYDYSGEWMFTVGLPAKSGVAGCIWCVVPNKIGLVTFSPKLDENGNSFRGVAAFKEFTRRFNFHGFDNLRGVVTTESTKKDPTHKKTQMISDNISALLFAAAQGDLSHIISLDSQGVNIWNADYDHRTALHLAASENHLNVVKFFIQKAKNTCTNAAEIAEKLSHRDRWGRTPLDDAVSGENELCVKSLIKMDAKRGAGSTLEFKAKIVNTEDILKNNVKKHLSAKSPSAGDLNNQVQIASPSYDVGKLGEISPTSSFKDYRTSASAYM